MQRSLSTTFAADRMTLVIKCGYEILPRKTKVASAVLAIYVTVMYY